MWTDIILAAWVLKVLDSHAQCPKNCRLGVVPGMHPMDIVHGCALVVETIANLRDAWAIVQVNSRGCCDSVPTLWCCRWLEAKGALAAVCATVVRHTMKV